MDSSDPKRLPLPSTNLIHLCREQIQWAYHLEAIRLAFLEPSPLGRSRKKVKMRTLSIDGLIGISFLLRQKNETLAPEDSLDSGMLYSKLPV